MSDLTGKFIANSYQNLVQKPDLTKEEYYNGIGQPITVINRDAIGTVKMYGGSLSGKFDISTGLGVVGSEWEGWALCDGRNGTPDLRGRFVAGYTYTFTGDSSTNSQKNNTAFQQIGTAGAGNSPGDDTAEPKIDIDNLPPHRHTGVAAITEDNAEIVSNFSSANTSAGINKMNRQSREGVSWGSSGADLQEATAYYNTGDGTNNIDNQGELKSTPDNFYPAFVALVYVMRVS
jgi:hypothetical protein